MIRLKKKIVTLVPNFFVQSSKPTSKRTIVTDSVFQLAIYILDQEVAIHESLSVDQKIYVRSIYKTMFNFYFGSRLRRIRQMRESFLSS
jgi:hypothetical protein